VPSLGGSYWTTFLPAILVLGFGMAVSVAPLTTTVMGAVEGNHAGIASGINNAVSRCAGLLAIAALGLLMQGLFGRGLDHRLTSLALPAAALHEMEENRTRLAAMQAPASLPEAQRANVHDAVEQSFLEGYRGVMLAAAGLALLASASAWGMIKAKP